MHPYVKLAKKAVEEFINSKTIPALPSELSEDMKQRAGVFVCLKKDGQLRGCIGTFQPCFETLYEEIVHNAVSASTQDPRFLPVTTDELDQISYTVDILSTPEKNLDISDLNPKKFGIIVAKGNKRGLLLPDLEGVDTVEQQLSIARMKAGIGPQASDVEIFQFLVERYI
jgi:AmmeMemoRadiSam system protein A